MPLQLATRSVAELALIAAAVAYFAITSLAYVSGNTVEDATIKGIVALLVVGAFGWLAGRISEDE